MVRTKFKVGRVLPLAIAGLLAVAQAGAQVAREANDSLAVRTIDSEQLRPANEVALFGDVRSALAPAVAAGWDNFTAGKPVQWTGYVDGRTGRIANAEGGGIAWVPGRGNQLHYADLGLAKASDLRLSHLEAIARGFLPQVADLLGVDPRALVLSQGRSGQPAGHLWYVDFDVVLGGVKIEGARVTFTVNNGNLILFGSENLPSAGTKLPAQNVSREAAATTLWNHVGGFQLGDSLVDRGTYHLLPASIANDRFPEGFEPGKGRGVIGVWEFVFKRDGFAGTWRGRVDASTGALVEFRDINDYASAQVTGGAYQTDKPATERVLPSPFDNVGTGVFSNSAGIYNNTGSVSSTMSGQYVVINDTCGSISQASDGSGNIAFGTSTGTDCTTPGHGGAGNTHASRTQFYMVNRAKEIGRGWLPSNSWLNGSLTVKVNLNQTCNAYWDGTALNFFKSGGGCNNTGELPGVSLHEWGHGLDQNDGNGSSADGGTGESYGDTSGVLFTHQSCMGSGFLNSNCSGYGDACTSCTGVRDLDFAKHSSNTAYTVDNFTRVHCPAGSGGAGPCGQEVHCESLVGSQTIWDLPNRDLPSPGSGSAWATLDRLWYLSRSQATSMFTCSHSSIPWTASGCSTGSLWKTLRAVDDDDGNLTNGTPHGGALFASFNRHGIACTTDPGASTTFRGCTQPAVPTLTATPGNNSVALSWSGSSGVYDVYKNENGCNSGFIKAANDVSTTSFTDNAVANGLTYFYQVVAQPSGNEACGSSPSTCVSVTPAATSTPDFTISASPSSVSVVQGNNGTSTISTAISGGFNAAIALSSSGAPSGTTVSFNPTSIAAPGSGSSTMTIAVGAATATGSYTITVTGTGGSVTHTTSVSLTVTSAPVPDFTISASPTSVSVVQGNNGTSTISTAISGGFNAAIALSSSGAPTGTTVTLNPTSIAAPGSGSSTMTMAVGAATASGTYAITVTGTGGGKTHTATVSLTVTATGGSGLTNGGFETGSLSPWTSTGSASVIAGAAHSGGFGAQVGSTGPSTDSSIVQTFTLPAGSPQLSFWYNNHCPDTITFDWATATLKDNVTNVTTTVLAKTCAATATWTQVNFNASASAGHSVTLTLSNHDDNFAGDPTFTWYDDVTVSTGGDTTAPTTSITAPANGATVSGTVTISASASDNVGVTRVEIYIDSTLKSTLTSAPYNYSWNTTTYSNGSHSIFSKAYDAANNVGTSATISVTVSNGGGSQQLLVNPGFETGTATPWVATAGVIDNSAGEPAHSGSWKAWLDGYGSAHTDSLYQQVAIPSTAVTATLTFWLHIDTAETTTTSAFDTLNVQIRNSSGTVLATLATYSNLNHNTGYAQKSFDVSAYKGQTIQVYLIGVEDASLQTSFVVDDFALNVQ